LATPNYGYEKRQKELAKKRKKEDKLKSKSERKVGGDYDGVSADPSHEGPEGANSVGQHPDSATPAGS
jgi:hypothetical protein